MAAYKLEERVERQELDAGHAVDALGGRELEHFVLNLVGAGVAVVIRVFEQVAGFAEQGVVAAPGVETDAGQADIGDELEALPHFVPEPEDVPLERAVVADRLVGEPADVLEQEDAVVDPAEDGAAAFGAEVECQEARAHDPTTLPR